MPIRTLRSSNFLAYLSITREEEITMGKIGRRAPATLAPIALAWLALAPLSAAAQPGEDPTWPCVQRKVEDLSLGLMWPHPVEERALDEDQQVLVETLALRRVTLEAAEAEAAAYMADHPGAGEAELSQIFAGVFARLSRERRQIIGGIERYADGQHALSERIDANRIAFREAEAADPPDFDRLDTLEAEIDWDERIFQDRAQSLTYVCESPVLLEQRLYAIAQMLKRQAP
jgi:hypothetical protein